ncbi:MAG: right-handed parallel beta-helix repeat-containing protein [Candidatus Margulisbacteria bacterium]|nr:right-handed parallel beta-helix repeat-containing protein [Candidatus Margulisiibacteriota bacterium]
MRKKLILTLLFLALALTAANAATRVVTNCADSGAGSLRQALTDAAAGDVIIFDITTAEAGYSSGESSPGLVITEAVGDRWFRIMVKSILPTIGVSNLFINGSSQTREANNALGPKIELRRDSTNEATDFNGLDLNAASCTIEGLVINRFDISGSTVTREAGILIRSSSNEVRNCYIGTDATGTVKQPNYHGIRVLGGNFNLIGTGTLEGERNLISGNDLYGLLIQSAARNEVRGNYIGTDRTGMSDLGNKFDGVRLIANSTFNKIGGEQAGARNVISGNDKNGVYLGNANSVSNEVKGNLIGTKSNGMQQLANSDSGVWIDNAARYNVIGGAGEARNVISGNSGDGVQIGFSAGGTDHNQVKGNYIGVAIDGITGLGNTGTGINLYQASYTVIGGATTAEGNIICCNGGRGIGFYGEAACSNEVTSNFIGTDKSGILNLGNKYEGISIAAQTKHDITGPNNVIAFNGINGIGYSDQGIQIIQYGIDPTVFGNQITRNSMYQNYGKGITLSGGANAGIAAPRIRFADYNPGPGPWTGFTALVGTAPASSTLEVFDTGGPPDPSGYGEGKIYKGVATVEVSGNFWLIYTASAWPAGTACATATDGSLNTSEFSNSRFINGVSPTSEGIELSDRITGSTTYTNNRIVSLEAFNVSEDAYQMKISEEATCEGAVWQDYLNPTTFELTAVEGAHTVYYKLIDVVTMESTIVSASIILDTIHPSVESIVLRDRTTGSTLESNELTISLEAVGVSADAYSMRIAQDSGFTVNSTGWIPYTATSEYTFTSGDGPRTAYFQVRDHAINESNIVSDSIILFARPPSVEVLSPDGGEKWRGGSSHNITFTCSDEYGIKPGSADLFYSTGEGTAWITINTGQATDAAYSWTLPLISSTEVKVKVSVQNVFDNIGSDESNAVFAIDSRVPSVEVHIPNGGEKWQGGISHEVTWTASDVLGLKVDPITIYYSTDEGTNFIQVVSNESNDGSYIWSVPSLNTSEARVKISAEDQSGNIGSAESAANFIIDIEPPTAPLLLAPPNGSTTSDATPIFSWNASTDNLSGIASYEITIGTSVITKGASTSYAPAAPLPNATYTWEVRAKDGAGIWGNFSTSWTFTVDAIIPDVQGVILRDRTTGSSLESNELTVTVEAVEVSADTDSMRLAQDSGFTVNSTGWITYAATSEYTFTPGDGLRTAYFQVRDHASNESFVVNGSITINTSVPTCSAIVLSDRRTGSQVYSGSLTVSVEARGVTGSPTAQRLSGNNLFDGSGNDTGWIAFNNPTEFTLTSGNGTREVYYKIRNLISTESAVFNDSIIVDTVGPVVSVILPNGGERYAGNSSAAINWTASDNIGLTPNPITLRYSTNGGSSWSLIAGGRANTPPYAWTTPQVSSAQCRVSVEAEDLVGHRGSAMSAANFIIDSLPPTVPVLIAPTNYSLTLETTQALKWLASTNNLTGVASYEIRLDGWTITLGVTTEYQVTLPYGLHTWEVRAKDGVGNWSTYSPPWSFEIKKQSENIPPVITIEANGIRLWDNDYISSHPRFDILITDNVQLNPATVKVVFAGAVVPYSIIISKPAYMKIAYQPATELKDESEKTYDIRVEASDMAGNIGTKEVDGLKASLDKVRVIGPVITMPASFSPQKGQTCKLVYTLNKDADTTIYIFGTGGTVEQANRFSAMTNGGRAGYNETTLTGRTGSGNIYGNGIYVVKIVAENRVIGTGHMVIFD